LRELRIAEQLAERAQRFFQKRLNLRFLPERAEGGVLESGARAGKVGHFQEQQARVR